MPAHRQWPVAAGGRRFLTFNPDDLRDFGVVDESSTLQTLLDDRAHLSGRGRCQYVLHQHPVHEREGRLEEALWSTEGKDVSADAVDESSSRITEEE